MGQIWKEGLCTGCIDNCSSEDIYYGDTGAFRCLTEGSGDVAFVKHTTVLDYASDGEADEELRSWSDKPMSDFKLLCRDGGCADVNEFATCNLAAVVNHGIVGSPALSRGGDKEDIGQAVRDAFVKAGSDFIKETTALVSGRDFLWSPGTKGLVPFDSDFVDTLMEGKIIETVREFENIVSEGKKNIVKVCIPYPLESGSVGFLRKCTSAVGLADSPELQFVCVEGGSKGKCIEMLESGEAHITTLDGGEVYASELYYGFTPIVVEETGEDSPKGTHYSVALVPKDFCGSGSESLADLQGQSACFSGYQKMAGWYVPVGAIGEEVDGFTDNDLPTEDIELDAHLVGEYFSKVCAPGLGLNGPKFTAGGEGELWDGLCSACKGDCSTNDIYYGDKGAFRCLSEGNGDVAFLRHTTVMQYAADGSLDESFRPWSDKDMSDYRLLCKEGGCDTVDNYAECNLGVAPGRALVVGEGLGAGGANEALGRAIRRAILFAADKTDFLEETKGLKNNFMWSLEAESLSVATEDYVSAESQGSLKAYENTFAVDSAGSGVDSEELEEIDEPVRKTDAVFCAKNEREWKFCRKFERVMAQQAPEFKWGCHQEGSTEGCLKAIALGDAHWKTVDGSDLYLGFTKYGLRAVVAEDRGEGLGSSYFSVAVVHDRICTSKEVSLKDLKDKKSCHTGYRKASGWDVPIGTMISTRVMDVVDNEADVENDAESAAAFFKSICAARTSDNGPQNSQDGLGQTWSSLCTACKGDCSNNEIYYGYEGAFRCFADEAGDVMFTRHNAIPEDASLLAPSLNQTRLKLLCKDKPGCHDLEDYASCHLARVPAPAVVVKYNTDLVKGSLFQNALVAASKTETFADLMFDEKRNPSNFIFSNDASGLIRIDSDMVTYLSDTDKIYRTLEGIRSSPDAWTKSSVIDVQTVNDEQSPKNGARSRKSPGNTLFASFLGAFLLLCFLQ